MKKILLLVMISLLCFIPVSVNAQEKGYSSLNLDEALTEEGIDHDFSNYEENNDQAIIYLFRGKGCGYCKKFLTFLNSIVDDYGKYFKVVSYEVWYDQENASLLTKVSNYLGTSAEGVPYIVIGDKVFPGYASSYDEDIKDAIKKQYDSKNEYDVMKKISVDSNSNSKTEVKNTKNNSILSVILISIFASIFVIGAIVIIVIFNLKDKKVTKGE